MTIFLCTQDNLFLFSKRRRKLYKNVFRLMCYYNIPALCKRPNCLQVNFKTDIFDMMEEIRRSV